MTLLKDNSYKSINVALLSLENDIKKLSNFDTSAINRQLEEINERIDEINDGSNSNSSNSSNSGNSGDNSAEINDLKAEIEDIEAQVSNNSTKINDIRTSIEDTNNGISGLSTEIGNIEQKLSNIFLAENFVEDFNTATESGIYYWNTNTANRPATYGVLVVYEKSEGSYGWTYQTAYATDASIYYRVKINEDNWTGWRTIAYEDITKTYTIPDVTSATARYIKLGTFPWWFDETVKVRLDGNCFADTVEFNILGGNASNASVNGWYTTNNGKTTGIYVVPVAPVEWNSNIEVWLRVEQTTTLTVKLTGNAIAAQYFNTNAQMNNTQTYPTGAKLAAYFNMKRGFFGYNESCLNCYDTTMTSLGFTNNQVVSVSQFAQALINYTGLHRGQVYFTWADANRAYIKATTPYNTQFEINGGTIIFHSRTKNVSDAWNTFDAQYINRLGEVYTFGIQKDSLNAIEFVRREVDTSTTNALRTNVDAGYLCKHYDIGGHTNQAYNVILLGKIPDPASTAAPATPSTSWDIDVDFYFVRSQGHKASWCNVKAGYGYSNEWRKYGFIETFGIDMSTSYNNPFYLVTLKYNNEWYIGVRHIVDIDGNYAARVKNVNIAGDRNPSTVGNTPLANMLKAIGYLKTDGTVLNSEINSSIANLPNTYAPTVERNSSLVLRNNTDVSLSSFGQEPLSIGFSGGDNLGIDSNEIQARFNGKVAPLYINGNGGKVYVNDTKNSSGGLQVDGNTTLLGNSNVGLSSYGKDPLSIGPSSGKNIGIDGDDIQARNNGAASSLDLNYYGGMVNVNAQGLNDGGLQVGRNVTVQSNTDVTLSSYGLEPLSIGLASEQNLGFDTNEIQARKNGNASTLYLNNEGGTVDINYEKNNGNGGLRVGGNTTLLGNSNVGLSNFGKEPLSIGAATGVNLGFDGNEIQARNDGYASSLHLNYYGGLVMINNANISSGGLKVRGRLNIPTSAPSNPQEGDIWLVL